MDKAQQERHDRIIEQMRRILGSDICAAFEDPKVVEILLNDDGRVLVERHGQGISELTTMPDSKAVNLLGLMADYRGTTVSRDKPIVEGAMPPEFLRARFAGCIPPLTPAPTFAIRLPARSVFMLEDYVSRGILTDAQYEKITAAIRDRKNIIVSGGTGCFAKGHPILMFDGSIKAVEDVAVGDKVMGPDGRPRVVKDVHSGLDEMIRVVPLHGRSFVVNRGHSFAVVDMGQPVRKLERMPLTTWLSHLPRNRYWLCRFRNAQSGIKFVPTPIVKVRSLGFGTYYGFEVDHPDHLFVDGNFLVQGNSGKTTLLNACSDYVSRIAGMDQRIVAIEDTDELRITAPNVVKMLTDPDSGIDMTRLLKLTLRYRPDRIFVGEVRDASALALLKAWNTGHPGGLATLHANNPTSALTRLDQLCQEAGVPSQKYLIEEAVDVVIQIARDPGHPAGRRITDILFLHNEE
ncbi:type II secretion system protein E [Acidithiobacillus caldus]|nr:type II secretion system protein E [Acidithiobacillus caldus]